MFKKSTYSLSSSSSVSEISLLISSNKSASIVGVISFSFFFLFLKFNKVVVKGTSSLQMKFYRKLKFMGNSLKIKIKLKFKKKKKNEVEFLLNRTFRINFFSFFRFPHFQLLGFKFLSPDYHFQKTNWGSF